MTNLSNSLLPRSTFVGFDRLFDEVERMAQTTSTTNYPPYNIIKVSDDVVHIELAVAGFQRNEIEVTVKENLLTISGSKESDPEHEYIHKGISARKFERVFRLHEYARVSGADLRDGILTLAVMIVVPEEKKPRKIEIGTGGEPQLLLEE
jgi:molecular chaperone IbpA